MLSTKSYPAISLDIRPSILILAVIFFVQVVSCRQFHSRDIHVSGIIADCENEIGPNPADFPTGKTRCQAILGCILRSVGAYTAARWSAGASILAFIPTITAVMSNSIEEIVHIADEDSILAVMLGFCSVTMFASRFGSNRELYTRTGDALSEHVRLRLEKSHKAVQEKQQSFGRRWRVVHYIAYAVLLTACAAVWFPTVVILRNGVVVFSCPTRLHVPLWIGLTQLTVVANVLLRKFLYDRTIIVNRHPQSTQSSGSTSRPKGPLSYSIILRVPRAGFVSKSLRGFSSTITFALYTLGTAVFGAMTMFTASDAVWCLVLYAFAAGVSRVVANFIFEDYAMCRRTIVVDVSEQQIDKLKERVEQLIQ